MRVEDGKAEALTEDELADRLRNALREHVDDPDLSTGSVYNALAKAHADVFATQQERDLVTAYEGGFLDAAAGDTLERVVAILGLERKAAVGATGIQTFKSSDPVSQTYNIPAGTTVQTASGLNFDTLSDVAIPYWDGFEDTSPLNDYSGDTTAYETDTTVAYEGNASLKSKDGESGVITLDGSTSVPEQTHTFRIRFDSASANANKGGIEIGESIFIILDATNNDVTVGGTVESHSIPEDEWLYVEATARMTGDTTAYIEDESGTEIATITHGDTPLALPLDGQLSIRSGTGVVNFDECAAKSASANIQAQGTGVETNVGANQINAVTSTVSGVDNTSNPYPTGGTNRLDLNGDNFIAGSPQESDAELRERARQTSGSGGAASVDALVGTVLEVPNVNGVSLFENDSDSQDSGLPPVSFEMVIDGGTDTDVATAIFEEKAATARDFGGNNGVDTSVAVEAVNGQTFDVRFSRPQTVAVDIDLSIVVTGDYAGDNAVKRAIVEYIGGIGPQGANIDGLGIGEDVIINQLESRIGDVSGVVGVNSSATSYTPSTTQDSDGLEVIAVADNERADVDGTDASITISRTER